MAKIALAQTIENGNIKENLETAKRLSLQAKNELGAELLVFPENFMSHPPLASDRSVKLAGAQTLEGPFVKEMAKIAKELGLWMIFGMRETTENPKEDDRNYNTIVIVNDAGDIVATYRKTHLYDAFGHLESDDIKPGDKLFEPIETPFGKIGIYVCYELRFPEISRRLAEKGAEIIIVPTAWVKGEHKSHHFNTLVSARAIENTVFICACDMYGEDCLGESMIVDPMGEKIAFCKEGEQLICADIDVSKVYETRKVLPSAKNCRKELY